MDPKASDTDSHQRDRETRCAASAGKHRFRRLLQILCSHVGGGPGKMLWGFTFITLSVDKQTFELSFWGIT